MTVRSAIIVSALIIVDQATKLLVSANLKLNESLPFLNGLLHITRVHNSGIAFGFFKGMLLVSIFLSLVAVFLIVLCASRFRYGYTHLRAGLLLILGGTTGNLIDRIRLGYVVDFIDLRVWPVFNIADMAITIGGLFLAYHIIITARIHSQ